MKTIFNFFLILIPLISNGQIDFSSNNWLKDGTTIPFDSVTNRTKLKSSFNGVRIVYEPQLGVVLQNGDNRFQNKLFLSLSKIGAEINLYEGIISLQLLGIAPSTIQFDDRSPLRINRNTIDSTGKVNIDYGGAVGLSFLDGIFSIGFGGIFYDKRDFINVLNLPKNIYQNNFVYINLQPISLIKVLIKDFPSPSKRVVLQ